MTISGDSVELLLPLSLRAQAPAGSPNMVYAHISASPTTSQWCAVCSVKTPRQNM